MSPEMKDVRWRCFRIRSEWQQDNTEIKRKLENLFRIQLEDNWGNAVAFGQLQQTEEYEDYACLTVLLRWFDMVSHYDFDKDTSHAIAFYFYWWQNFLKSITDMIKAVYIDVNLRRDKPTLIPQFVYMPERIEAKISPFIKKEELREDTYKH